jgi:hypothetical protein
MRVSKAEVLTRIRRAHAIALAATALACLSGPSAAAEKHVSPLTTILNTKFYADPGRVPDFVEKSRPAGGSSDYIPLRAPQPERRSKPKTAAELKAMEAELAGAGVANRRRAGQSAADAAKKPSKVSTVRSGSAAPIH